MNEPIAEGWITMVEEAELSGYSPAYVRQLADRGRIEARKVGHGWLIEKQSLEAYKTRMDGLGVEKHNPWRGDLAEQGRGRLVGRKVSRVRRSMVEVAMTRSGARFLAYLRACFPGCADAVLSEALVIQQERAALRLGRRHLVKALKQVCQLPLPGGVSPSPV